MQTGVNSESGTRAPRQEQRWGKIGSGRQSKPELLTASAVHCCLCAIVSTVFYSICSMSGFNALEEPAVCRVAF